MEPGTIITTDGTSVPKTAVDIQLENLNKEMAELKDTYEKQLKEYADANKELWAALHKAPADDTPQEPVEQAGDGFDMDKAIAKFNACYGITKEE